MCNALLSLLVKKLGVAGEYNVQVVAFADVEGAVPLVNQVCHLASLSALRG